MISMVTDLNEQKKNKKRNNCYTGLRKMKLHGHMAPPLINMDSTSNQGRLVPTHCYILK